MREVRRSVLALGVSVLMAACGGGGGEGQADPAGTTTLVLPANTALDLETGMLLSPGLPGADLFLDGAGNLQATDALAAAGGVSGLAAVRTFPSSGWIPAHGAIPGQGFVVKTDTSNAYALFVEAGPQSSSRTLKWAPLPGLVRLEVERTGTGFGGVTSSPPGIACLPESPDWDCAEVYPAGTVVTLSAAPVTHPPPVCDLVPGTSESTFGGWSGGGCSGTGTCAVTVAADTLVAAGFVRMVPFFAPDPAASGAGGTVSVSAGGAVPACDGTHCRYLLPAGTAITVTALPDQGLVWSGWLGSGQTCSGARLCSGAGASCSFTLGASGSAAECVKAAFAVPCPPGGCNGAGVSSGANLSSYCPF